MEKEKPVYFKIITMEAGAYDTGSRKANYHCHLIIYDESKTAIEKTNLSDNYYGKWPKCETFIRKWEKLMLKNKLTRI